MSKITTQQIQIHNNGVAIDSYLALPEEPKASWGIVVIQEIFGVNAHIKDVTERFAKQGYIAIAPAIYQRSAPGFEANYDAEGVRLGQIYKGQTKAEELTRDIQAAVDYLKTFPQVQKIGTIGFCFGGHVVYLAAGLDSVDATASFYGGGIATFRPGGGEPTVKITPQIAGKVYAFFGERDSLIPLPEIDEIEQALMKRNSDNRVFRYPETGHGFFCDRRDSYNKEASLDAWTKVLSLFS